MIRTFSVGHPYQLKALIICVFIGIIINCALQLMLSSSRKRQLRIAKGLILEGYLKKTEEKSEEEEAHLTTDMLHREIERNKKKIDSKYMTKAERLEIRKEEAKEKAELRREKEAKRQAKKEELVQKKTAAKEAQKYLKTTEGKTAMAKALYRNLAANMLEYHDIERRSQNINEQYFGVTAYELEKAADIAEHNFDKASHDKRIKMLEKETKEFERKIGDYLAKKAGKIASKNTKATSDNVLDVLMGGN